MSRQPDRKRPIQRRQSFHEHASNRTSRPESEARATTSWDPVANWYTRWIGTEGSDYHRSLAIPAVLELLRPRPDEVVADIGCGAGILLPSLPEDVRYIGIDASPRLLAAARQRYGRRRREAGRARENRFVLADSARLQASPELKTQSADAVVFMLSIQDMEPLDDVLAGAAWLLKESGRLVILMMHPCFRVPRQSGWGWDDGRRLQYRRVDAYLSPRAVPVRPIAKGKPGSIKAYHLPLEAYVNGLVDAGFRIERFAEIPAYPAIARTGNRAKAENRANSEIPLFLALRAIRK